MKTTYRSERNHWAIGHEFSCVRCDSRFVPEAMDDFTDGYNSEYVIIGCPECNWHDRHYKPRKPQPQFQNPMPCKDTWKKTVDNKTRVEMIPKSEGDWMGNLESQQEYLGK